MLRNGFESVPCCVCGATDAEELRPSTRTNFELKDLATEFRSSADAPLTDRLVKCLKCDCVFVSPRIDATIALTGYTESPDEVFASQDSWRVHTFEAALRRIFHHIDRHSIHSAFDIGAGSGAFLKACKNAGLQVQGCEPNVWLAEWASRNHAMEVLPVSFEQLSIQRRFDLVSLWDVIEHLSNPNKTIARAKGLINPDGILIINYPDYSAFPAKLLGRKWPFWLTAHFWYFTETTMSRLLQKHSLRVLAIERFWQTLSLQYVFSRGLNVLFGNSVFSRLHRLIPAKIPAQYYLGQKMVVARLE